MKRKYSNPMAEKIEFSFQEQIVATSRPTGTWYITICGTNECGHQDTCYMEQPAVTGIQVQSFF